MIKNTFNKTLPFVLIILACLGCGYDPKNLQRVENAGPLPAASEKDKAAANKWVLDVNDPKRVVGRVVHISDGDTFIIEGESGKRTTVRIHAIDAPELSQTFGRESRERLRALVANQQLEIREINRDQFKRIVGQVFLNGKDMGLEMVRGGYVWHFKQYDKQQPVEDRKLYADAEKSARNSHIGLWSDANPIQPQNYRRKKGTRN